MKKYIIIIFAGVVLLGCADGKKQEKLLLDSVIAVHDKVMGNEEQLMKNKMILDSLRKHDSVTVAKGQITELLKSVDSADNAMSDWMHKFDAENKGKSHQEIMDYLGDQKKKITAIDSQINAAVSESNKFLSTYQK